jgi:phenol 2-monooxygenase
LAQPVKGTADLTSDLHKIFIDDESYNSGHGKAYEFYGIDPKQGALAIVRPDQCRLPLL